MAEEIEAYYLDTTANLGVSFPLNYFNVALFDIGDGTPALLLYKSAAENTPYEGAAW